MAVSYKPAALTVAEITARAEQEITAELQTIGVEFITLQSVTAEAIQAALACKGVEEKIAHLTRIQLCATALGLTLLQQGLNPIVAEIRASIDAIERSHLKEEMRKCLEQKILSFYSSNEAHSSLPLTQFSLNTGKNPSHQEREIISELAVELSAQNPLLSIECTDLHIIFSLSPQVTNSMYFHTVYSLLLSTADPATGELSPLVDNGESFIQGDPINAVDFNRSPLDYFVASKKHQIPIEKLNKTEFERGIYFVPYTMDPNMVRPLVIPKQVVAQLQKEKSLVDFLTLSHSPQEFHECLYKALKKGEKRVSPIINTILPNLFGKDTVNAFLNNGEYVAGQGSLMEHIIQNVLIPLSQMLTYKPAPLFTEEAA